MSGRDPERDTSRAVSVLLSSKTAISCLSCSQIRKQHVLFFFLKKEDSNTGEEDTVLPASVANWVLNNLIADRRLRPTRAQAQDISEQLHLAVILTPSLPYFLSPYIFIPPHTLGGSTKAPNPSGAFRLRQFLVPLKTPAAPQKRR